MYNAGCALLTTLGEAASAHTHSVDLSCQQRWSKAFRFTCSVPSPYRRASSVLPTAAGLDSVRYPDDFSRSCRLPRRPVRVPCLRARGRARSGSHADVHSRPGTVLSRFSLRGLHGLDSAELVRCLAPVSGEVCAFDRMSSSRNYISIKKLHPF